MRTVLETYPRDELFQIDLPKLSEFAREIVALGERPRLRVLPRVERFNRFVSILTFIPRDRYDTSVRHRVGSYLAKVYAGHLSAASPFYPEGPLVRTHYIIGREGNATPVLSSEELESAITNLVRTWTDSLKALIKQRYGVAGNEQIARYGEAFSAAYRDIFDPQEALSHISILEQLSPKNPRTVILYRPFHSPLSRANLKVFSWQVPLPLSERVPLLEHMGFRVVSESTYGICPGDSGKESFDRSLERIWLHDMVLERPNGGNIDVASYGPMMEAALKAIFEGKAESDGYDALILQAGLAWRDIALLRSLSRYLRQIRIRFSQDYMWDTLNKFPHLSRELIALFYARFDPHAPFTLEERAQREKEIVSTIESMLMQVGSLDEDRILRRFLNLIQAAVRTNFFHVTSEGQPPDTIAFKFESQKIDGLPLPKPLYEITLYSPRVEGIHLRFGKVARGGIRWSDRPQDFRTEILGLVKAQQVKNAVIVPVGAKGGFVPKLLPVVADRNAILEEGVQAYKIFMRTLLSLTDNRVAEYISHPPLTICYDGEDPYLVVAADKGTASFSDLANEISLHQNFWLGDAFASGGSVGYDHKKMAITARGAWEAVKRHFREMDRDIQTTRTSVVGIGDMSGDVFGNGVLLSPCIHLLGAFDHRDIFIDPDPDLAAAFLERKRLFELPRSSWQDYRKEVLSVGGGVFSRALKSISLTLPIREKLGIEAEKISPQDLIVALLKASVDLLWFGGIGTYVRASTESEDNVGDRSNDAIRIAASDLRCKVVGEGANLGMTQLARVEAALAGVRLNTDAIDNSAGVNTSDIEVNIKIVLTKAIQEGTLKPEERNALLLSLGSEVSALVLRNNYQQSLALSLAQRRGVQEIMLAKKLIQTLEGQGRLDRAVEFLPDDRALSARAAVGVGLTRPEFAVLLAYAKLTLHDALLSSDIPDDPYLLKELTRYFPSLLSEKCPSAVRHHRLRREIIATTLSNAIINRGGPTLLQKIGDKTGADPAIIAKSFSVVRDSFSLIDLHIQIDLLDGKISGNLQLELYGSVQDLLLSRLVWFIRNVDFSLGLEEIVPRFKQGVETLKHILQDISSPNLAEQRAVKAEALEKMHVSKDLAQHLASLKELSAAPDIVLIQEATQNSFAYIAKIFFEIDELFKWTDLMEVGQAVNSLEEYEALALDRLLDGQERIRRNLMIHILRFYGGAEEKEDAVSLWSEANSEKINRARKAIQGALATGFTLTRRIVVTGHLADLVNSFVFESSRKAG